MAKIKLVGIEKLQEAIDRIDTKAIMQQAIEKEAERIRSDMAESFAYTSAIYALTSPSLGYRGKN